MKPISELLQILVAQNSVSGSTESPEQILSQYRYKRCGDCIVVLLKTKDTIDNEDRSDVFDPRYAKFRANEMYVKCIIDIETGQSIESVENTFYKRTILYQTGKVATVEDYDTQIDNICSTGIHYFKTLEAAYYYRLPTKGYNGLYKEYYDNGQLQSQRNYQDGKEVGICEEYYINGGLIEKYTCQNGKLHGVHEWYKNGSLIGKREFQNGRPHGPFEEYYQNGQIKIKCNYKYGEPHGPFEEYYQNGQIKIKVTIGTAKKLDYFKNGPKTVS